MTSLQQYTDGLERSLARVIADARRDMAVAVAEHRAALAECQAQLVAAKAEVVDLKATLMGHAEALVAKAVEALPQPEPVDLSGLVTRDAFEGWRDHINTETGAIEFRLRQMEERPEPEPVDLSDVRDELKALREKNDGQHVINERVATFLAPIAAWVDEMGPFTRLATRDEVEAVRAAIPEVPEPKDWSEEVAEIERAVGTLTDATHEGMMAVREEIARAAERPGTFPVVKAWQDGVHYEGAVVTHDGALWQAQRDTGKAPGHEDWRCIVERGEAGRDGATWEWRGLFSEAEQYVKGDVVAGEGGSFVAITDDPGPCPGDGWRGIAQRGKPGRPGDKGDKGDKGPAGPAPVALVVDDEARLTLALDDGETLTADFYPLLAKVAR